MLHLTKSSNILGMEVFEINVEVDITRGLPCFSIVGLAATEIKESRERVKSAIINSGFKFPRNRIVVNLSPADIKKSGSILDFAIAVGIIRNLLKKEDKYLKETYFVGELSLKGSLRFTNGILPIVTEAKKKGIKRIFIPFENLPECYLIEGINIIPVTSLSECIKYINNENYEVKKNKIINIEKQKIQITDLKTKENLDVITSENSVDFKYIKGNSYAKRCAEICVAGNHNFLMIGAPGSGKSLLANAIETIMPKMSLSEKIEISKIYSLAGLLNNGKLINKRPFRAPHHTTTKIALIGGGRNAYPGEITLAHKGILFLDEVAEFDRHILETLRQPIEDGYINICRLKKSVKYPSKWLLVAAMNPCP